MNFLSPVFNEQTFDANGDPLVGGKVYTYAAGTSTPLQTYTTQNGTTQQANPIILDARGEPPNPIWLLGSGQEYKFQLHDANDNLIRTIDDVSGVNDLAASGDEWVTSTLTPTYISATSFSFSGDQTLTFPVGRRVRTANSGGTVYSTIATSVFFAGVTTITVTNDAGTLDAGLSIVAYGILSPVNPSLPNSQAARNSLGLGTTNDIASAAALPLSTCLGNLVRVTGTTTTTSLVMSNGQQVTCVAVGAWPINVSGVLSYTCIPGDTVRFMQDNNGTQTAVVTSRPASTNGCCRLTAQSNTNLILLPFNGNTITINGKIATIPAAGVTLSSSGSGSTLYYIYAYLSSGVLTLERSTTGHSTDASTGVEIKTGDPTRTLVGMAQSGANLWLDNTDFRYVLSYFNRRNLVCSRGFTAGRTTTLGGYSIINAEITCFWLTWADEPVRLRITGAVSNSGAFLNNTAIGIDSSTTPQDSWSPAVGSNLMPISCAFEGVFSEGAHNSTLIGSVAGGTATWVGGGSGNRTVHQAIIRG